MCSSSMHTENLTAHAGNLIGQAEGKGAFAAAELSTRRLAKLRAVLAEKGVFAMMVRDTSNIFWLSAFDGVFDEERAHTLIVTPERAVLHTDSRYATACKQAAEGGPIEVDDEVAKHEEVAARVLASCGADVGAADVLAIEDTVSLSEYRRVCETVKHPFETKQLVENLRAVKDAAEIARLREAQRITDEAFEYIAGVIRPGMTEREVQRALENRLFDLGADSLSFPTIVATGANAAKPHSIPGDTVLERGHVVVLDFGARAGGYCADMTRTVSLGEPSPEISWAYETLQKTNETCEAAIRAGKTGREIHELAEQLLEEAGFAHRMGHGLGHGVGIDIHEQPTLSLRNEAELRAGNVVTVEPGIYLPGRFGMRLEDFGVVTEEGFEVITKTPHDMVIID